MDSHSYARFRNPEREKSHDAACIRIGSHPYAWIRILAPGTHGFAFLWMARCVMWAHTGEAGAPIAPFLTRLRSTENKAH